MRDGRFEVTVTIDGRRGYVAHAQRAADHHCVVARRRINERLIGEDPQREARTRPRRPVRPKKGPGCAAAKREAEEERDMLMLASSSSSARQHRVRR
jgi:hypothetical protein